jgi:hypothetical protein
MGETVPKLSDAEREDLIRRFAKEHPELAIPSANSEELLRKFAASASDVSSIEKAPSENSEELLRRFAAAPAPESSRELTPVAPPAEEVKAEPPRSLTDSKSGSKKTRSGARVGGTSSGARLRAGGSAARIAAANARGPGGSSALIISAAVFAAVAVGILVAASASKGPSSDVDVARAPEPVREPDTTRHESPPPEPVRPVERRESAGRDEELSSAETSSDFEAMSNRVAAAGDSNARAQDLVDEAWELVEGGDLDGARERIARARALAPNLPGLDGIEERLRGGPADAVVPARPAEPEPVVGEPRGGERPEASRPETPDVPGRPPVEPAKPGASAPPREAIKNGEVVERFADGKVKVRYSVDGQGRRTGAYVENYPSGKPALRAHYLAGQLHGPYTEFYESGRTKAKRTYHRDLLNGRATEFDEVGRIVSDLVFLDGRLSYTKSPEAIARGLAAIKSSKVAPLDSPAEKSEFAPLDFTQQSAALRRLRAYRYLCDVPTDVELSYLYGERTTAATHLLELVGHLEHTPQRPTACSDSLWKWGYEGTSQSNLFEGLTDPVAGVDGWIDDSDPKNIERVGHRRWSLDPSMKKTAFGSYSKFMAMYAFDGSGKEVQEPDSIAYPSRGYFPLGYIRGRSAWSLSLNPRRYAAPKLADVKVVVTPADANYRKGAPAEISFFTVNNEPFGFAYCIIFRPEVPYQNGARYWVHISGLRTTAGGPIEVEYLVEFFTVS